MAERLRRLQGEAADIARWAFWVQLRGALDPTHPEWMRAAWPLWRARQVVSVGKQRIMAEEYERCFGNIYTPRGYQRLAADAVRVGWRVHLEELLLGKLSAETMDHYMVMEGREHLDAALARGKGALLLFPHAGNVMLLIATLAWHNYAYTQYAARGLAPADVAAAHPEVFGHSRWRQEVREAREAAEDRLPARFLTLETPVRELLRTLERNELVGIAFDGRIGRKFVPAPWLGRTALLNPGPFRMALQTGAAIVPVYCRTPADGPCVAAFSPALLPEGHDAGSLMRAFLAASEPSVRRWPEEYGVWLAHCRVRAAVDDHPFFIDYAPDERYLRHMAS